MNTDNKDIDIRVYKKLTPLLDKQIRDLKKLAPNFNNTEIKPGEIEKHLDKFCSKRDVKSWILVFNKDKLLASLAVFKRKIKHNNNYILLGGVGGLRVRQDVRRQGIATKMMILAMQTLDDLNCDIAYLCANPSSFLALFYNKYGFVLLKKPYTFLGKSGKKYFERDGMIAPVNSPNIFQLIIKSQEPFDIGRGNW